MLFTTPVYVKNFIAKVFVMCWIVLLIMFALWLFLVSLRMHAASLVWIFGSQVPSETLVAEMRLLTFILGVSMIGGVSFVIKDFYSSVKCANIYTQTYADYVAGIIPMAEFQRIVPVEVYTRRFHFSWVYWFMTQPILSAILGVIAFAIVRSGLGAVQGVPTGEEIMSVRSIYLYCIFSFLAGFSSHKFLAWLDSLADRIFGIGLEKKKIEERASLIENINRDKEVLKEDLAHPSAQIAADATAPTQKSI